MELTSNKVLLKLSCEKLKKMDVSSDTDAFIVVQKKEDENLPWKKIG